MGYAINSSNVHSEPLWTPAYAALLLLSLLLCLGFYMLPATLPAYTMQMGGSNFQASLVIGAFSVMSLLARIFSSSIVDRFGERRVVVIGIFTIAVTTLAFHWVPVNGILALRAMQGVGWGLATAAIATAVFKIIPSSRRGEGSGYYALTVITSMTLTPLVAILIMNNFNFMCVLGLSAMLVMFSLSMLRHGFAGLPAQDTARKSRKRVSMRSIFEKGAVVPSILCFIITIPLCGVVAYLVLFGQEQGMGNIWLFFIGYSASILVTRPFIGRLFDSHGPALIVLPGCLFMVLGLFTLSMTHTTGSLVLASVIYGFGYGAVHPSLQAMAVSRCPTDKTAAANGLFLSSIDLGYIVGAVILGQVAQFRGYAMMYRYATLVFVGFLAVYLWDFAKHKSANT